MMKIQKCNEQKEDNTSVIEEQMNRNDEDIKVGRMIIGVESRVRFTKREGRVTFGWVGKCN